MLYFPVSASAPSLSWTAKVPTYNIRGKSRSTANTSIPFLLFHGNASSPDHGTGTHHITIIPPHNGCTNRMYASHAIIGSASRGDRWVWVLECMLLRKSDVMLPDKRGCCGRLWAL